MTEIDEIKSRPVTQTPKIAACFACGHGLIRQGDGPQFCSPRCQQWTSDGNSSRRDPNWLEVTSWRVVAGGDPGYLPTTPMREGKEGFWIGCAACGAEFESKGGKYCPTCIELPADERRQLKPAFHGRLCQGPGCENFLPRATRADARFCSKACRKRARRASTAPQSREMGTDNPGG